MCVCVCVCVCVCAWVQEIPAETYVCVYIYMCACKRAKDSSGNLYIYIYIYVCVCVCVCVYKRFQLKPKIQHSEPEGRSMTAIKPALSPSSILPPTSFYYHFITARKNSLPFSNLLFKFFTFFLNCFSLKLLNAASDRICSA